MKLKIKRARPPRMYAGTDRHTRMMVRKHGLALTKALTARAERLALNSGKPWKHREGRDFHTGLKRFLLRCISTIREIAR